MKKPLYICVLLLTIGMMAPFAYATKTMFAKATVSLSTSKYKHPSVAGNTVTAYAEKHIGSKWGKGYARCRTVANNYISFCNPAESHGKSASASAGWCTCLGWSNSCGDSCQALSGCPSCSFGCQLGESPDMASVQDPVGVASATDSSSGTIVSPSPTVTLIDNFLDINFGIESFLQIDTSLAINPCETTSATLSFSLTNASDETISFGTITLRHTSGCGAPLLSRTGVFQSKNLAISGGPNIYTVDLGPAGFTLQGVDPGNFGEMEFVSDAKAPDESIMLGDMNCDSVVNTGDVPLMVLALLDRASYESAQPACEFLRGDMNYDSLVDGLDVADFVKALVP